MSTTIWEPLRHIEEVDRLLSGLFSPSTAPAPERTWRPAAELVTEADAYRVRVDLPGVGKDGVDVSIERDVLTVRGERKPSVQPGTRDEAKPTVSSELRTGKFVRSFKLPEDADAADVNAAYVDGVLDVRVARRQPPQPRKVEIGNA